MKARYMKVADAKQYNLDQVIGMKQKYYGKDALLVRSGSYIYKVPADVYYAAY